jgi:ribosomal protein S18 acetylase RimI-like enzyme
MGNPAMARVDDVDIIRSLLQADRAWSVYALGDLVPEQFQHTTWFRAASGAAALVMLYHGFHPPVIFALGDAAAVESILDEMEKPQELLLHVHPEIPVLLRKHYGTVVTEAMWRMLLDQTRFQQVAASCNRLTAKDVSALEHLFADGDAAGEHPHFFLPAMVSDGVFFGVYEGDDLIAAAGTHMVSPREGIAAIGNVYTRSDRRGLGLAAKTTAAVTAELIRSNIETIALNVSQGNNTARRVYERLGFRRHCAFCEGRAIAASSA